MPVIILKTINGGRNPAVFYMTDTFLVNEKQ